MNFYPHHIGDFDRATRHLTRIERSVYRDLMDVYYDTEKSLTLDLPALCRKILARSNEESTAVEQTLNEFFIKTPTGWYHERCDAEIKKWNARGWFPHNQNIPRLRPCIDDWKKIRERIFLRDDYTCAYCEKRGGALECYHVVAVSLGGNSEDINLVTACRICNRKKGNKTTVEWFSICAAYKNNTAKGA